MHITGSSHQTPTEGTRYVLCPNNQRIADELENLDLRAHRLWVFQPLVFQLARATHSAGSEHFMAQFAQQEGSSHTDAATLRAFLEQDDGKEFIMLNQVQIYENDIAHPISGEMIPAESFLTIILAPLPALCFCAAAILCFRRAPLAALSIHGTQTTTSVSPAQQ